MSHINFEVFLLRNKKITEKNLRNSENAVKHTCFSYIQHTSTTKEVQVRADMII